MLYTAIFCIGCVATDGVLQDVYASSANTVLVKKTKADKNVIPDKYNTGAKGNLKKVKLVYWIINNCYIKLKMLQLR